MRDTFFNDFIVQLVDCRDIDNLIIKGHILTEYSLNLYIENNSKDVVDKKARFSYSNKLEIAQILGLFKNNKDLKKDLNLLNKLRNSIAHNLNYDKESLSQFLKSFDKIKYRIKNGEFAFLEDDMQYLVQNPLEKTKVNGNHMKFLLLVSYLCGMIIGNHK